MARGVALLVIALSYAAPSGAQKKELCSIADVFGQLQSIKGSKDCQAGCVGGKCPPGWMPRKKDKCSAACGKVFEPFWDKCGKMLTSAHMGGMDQMGAFYVRGPASLTTFWNRRTANLHCTVRRITAW
jgi:hypothetical protein